MGLGFNIKVLVMVRGTGSGWVRLTVRVKVGILDKGAESTKPASAAQASS